VMIFFIKV